MLHDPLFIFPGVFLIVGLVVLGATVFWIVELIDACRRQFQEPVMKIVWVLVVIFAHGIGAVVYYFVGKPQGRIPGEPRRH